MVKQLRCPIPARRLHGATSDRFDHMVGLGGFKQPHDHRAIARRLSSLLCGSASQGAFALVGAVLSEDVSIERSRE